MQPDIGQPFVFSPSPHLCLTRNVPELAKLHLLFVLAFLSRLCEPNVSDEPRGTLYLVRCSRTHQANCNIHITAAVLDDAQMHACLHTLYMLAFKRMQQGSQRRAWLRYGECHETGPCLKCWRRYSPARAISKASWSKENHIKVTLQEEG